MSSIQGLAGVQGSIDIRGMDLETAMLAIQTNRANLLEGQLKDQMNAVQAKNDKIAALNGLMGTLNGLLAKVDPNHNKSTDTVSLSDVDRKALGDAFKATGLDQPPELMQYEVKLRDGTKVMVDAAGAKEAKDCKDKNWAFRSNDYSGKKGVDTITESPQTPTKGDLDKMVANLKGEIDGMSNSQQMDMLRLQSLSNKRNEAFDIMTNFIKKMQENRSSIIGNMR